MSPVSRAIVYCIALSAFGQTSYNGIPQPDIWPPRDVKLTLEPQPAPKYLLDPPEVIPIDTGRQLFVDEFLIENTDLRRVFHKAQYFAGNPVMKADKPWEDGQAMPFSDGVFYDPRDRLYKMWYYGDNATLYATSHDGVQWDKPALDVRPGTNIVNVGHRDSSTVWLDLEEKDPARRYKMLYSSGHMRPLLLHYSADGIHWGEPVVKSIPWSDRTTFFWNPFRKAWVFSLRSHEWVPGQSKDDTAAIGRLRRYWEARDMAAGLNWKKEDDPVLWAMADRLDARRIDLNVQPQLYNLDAAAYESVLLGMFSIWHGQPTDRDKPNDISIGFTRDGFHWERPWRGTFIPVSERQGDWNYCNVQSAGGVCLVVGDRLYFYVSGRTGTPATRRSGNTATGLAVLRRDGFASMEAGASPGTLTTRRVRFSGRHLFVNADAVEGELRAEVLDENGRVIEPYSRANCIPVRSDNTLLEIRWKGAGNGLASLAGKPVRFRFYLRWAKLYAFWVSPEETGASHGYVAAGGPGFTGPVDTEGSRAYANCCKPTVW